ncbi:cAMP-regulated phosphoprotein 19-like [Ruditapes philippinarum]|uniref:cAMP-regulated phosphoprotein 19-like n=1 Tax=Ruditapes philippinarum TaxID=129788 RepID=UPI00295C3545|nr:cAMP-regulated phosphoprotein 19-like [Ruditapes philippinarum]
MSSETEQQDPNVPQNEDDGVDNKSQGTFKVPEQKSHVDIEREQEAKLKAKYGMRKPGGGSALLQKRLQKGAKYFDSGDYNMAKAKMNNPKHPLQPKEKLLLQESIGGAIPTPLEVEHMRRPSQQASNLVMEDEGGHPIHLVEH